MAVQAAIIAETIAGMKRVVRGRYELSDSDDPTSRRSSRGQKLKRKAHSIHEGGPSTGKVYKRKVEHAGYYRFILHRNPKRYDDDGDELEDDEADERADAEAAEENPYGQVKLENLLMPLTAAAELSNHPSLSIPYKSTTLSHMVQKSSEMLHHERRTLWTVKHLLTKFRGDSDWMPGDHLISDSDANLFRLEPLQDRHMASLIPRNLKGHKAAAEKVAHKENRKRLLEGPDSDIMADSVRATKATGPNEDNTRDTQDIRETQIGTRLDETGATVHIAYGKPATGESVKLEAMPNATDNSDFRNERHVMTDAPNTGQLTRAADQVPGGNKLVSNGVKDSQDNSVSGMIEPPTNDLQPREAVSSVDALESMENVQAPAHRMTTRAQAQAVSDKTLSSHTRTPSPNATDPPYIHPLYLIPQSSLPDRDFGLPSLEAEETRRMLIMWVQKQEEVVRGVERLYEGLLKADRMRKTLFRWCKSEGHVGEMSDGEDWYDKDEWGLEEDLKKGQLEEEDDQVTQGKKTRGRRTAQ